MIPLKIIIHHSLTEDSATVSWGAIRDYHVKMQKWADIGYHYGIEWVGDQYEIFKGRMDNEVGAHCIGFNDCSLGICVVGEFDRIGPNQTQIALLVRLVRSLMGVYNIKRDDVLGHWETYGLRGVPVEKSCPGNSFSMAKFRAGL